MIRPDTAEQDPVSLLRAGQAPLELRRFAAGRLLPLDREDHIRALLAVVGDPDPGIAAAAEVTLRGTSPDELLHFLREASPTGVELDRLARGSEDHFVLERIIRHKNVADQTLEALARTVTGAPQDALIVNHVRLLREPAVIDALLENPELTIDGRRRLAELREEFFDKNERRRQAERARQEEEARRLEEEEAAKTEETESADASGEEALDTSLTASALHRRIGMMTIAEKIELAYTGNKEERRILIGDANRLVGVAVLKSRSVTIPEIESFCAMRQLDDEIFRIIVANREWVRKQGVLQALIKNPGVPIAFTLPLVKHLPLREMRGVMRDPNLPEGIRIAARKCFEDRRK